MNVTVNVELLAAELRLLSKIVPAKPTLAILSHALLSADDDKLTLRATDLEVSLSGDCPANVSVPGVVALPVAKLLALVERFTEPDVNISYDKSSVLLRCGAFKSKLQTLSAEDFPAEAEIDGTTSTLDGEAFSRLITRTRYAVSPTSGKYVVQGALLTFADTANGPVVAMVATDGKRLALSTSARQQTGENQRVIIPIKTLDVLMQHIASGEVELTINRHTALFTVNNRQIVSRMLAAEFPAYERIIPRENTKVVSIDRQALLSALQRIILVSEESKSIFFDITAGHVQLTTSSATIGSADESLPVQYEGSSIKICVNGEHVIDFLESCVQPTVTMSLKDESTAMLLTEGNDHVAVIMLIRGR